MDITINDPIDTCQFQHILLPTVKNLIEIVDSWAFQMPVGLEVPIEKPHRRTFPHQEVHHEEHKDA
jgi:hypothetical protein